MNITLFGGSFNPPTLGHRFVIKQAFELIPDIGMIWLLPDYEHSFIKNETLAPAEDRLKMADLLIESKNKVRVEPACIEQKMTGNTIEHIRYLQKKYPKHRFSFLMGSDNLKTFRLWPDWQMLLNLIPFYIYPRAGYPMEPMYSNMMALTQVWQVITNISSTLVRERIRERLEWDHLVPPEISAYIRQKQLFLTA